MPERTLLVQPVERSRRASCTDCTWDGASTSLDDALTRGFRGYTPHAGRSTLQATVLSQLPSSPAPEALLDDRLRFTLPAGSRRFPRHVGGLMGMDISTLREELVAVTPAVGPGGEQLRTMMHVRDRFERIDEPLEVLAARAARGLAGSLEVNVSIAMCGGGRLLVLADDLAGQKRNDVLVGYAIVQHADGGACDVDFITDCGTASVAAADLRAHALRVMETFEQGPRRLDDGARVVRFGPPAGPSAMSLRLAAGHVWSADQGPDFVVHHLQRMRVTSAAATSDPWIVKLYFGGHPNPRLRAATGVTEVNGTLAGHAIKWTVKEEPGYVAQETIAAVSVGGLPVAAHVFSDHATAEAAAEARATVEQISLS